jgi:hypothetical protein
MLLVLLLVLVGKGLRNHHLLQNVVLNREDPAVHPLYPPCQLLQSLSKEK